MTQKKSLRMKRIASLLVGMSLVLCWAGQALAQWAGPQWEQQKLPMATLANARHLGGYPAADGRRVKQNVLLRTGALSGASREDIEILQTVYGLTQVIDLRTTQEAAKDPDPAIPGAAYHHLPLMEEGSQDSQAAIVEIYRLYGAQPGRAYVEMVRAGALSPGMYTDFLDSPAALTSFRQFFDVLLENREGAVLWHCTGGKDRAGLAAVLLLCVLGVDEANILADFALTNAAYSDKIASITAQAAEYTQNPGELEQAAALAGVSVPYMQRVFDLGRAQNGSLLGLIQEKIGLTDEEITALRDKYLE